MKKRTIFLTLLLFSLFMNGCKYDFIIPVEVPVIDNGGKPISFATQIAPIFSTGNKCTECHKPGDEAPDLTTANAYTQIMTKYVNISSPSDSKIYAAPGSNSHSWKKYTAPEAAIILAWIKEGAKNN